ncbi:hypothetical protein BDZ45DRAFT_740943 [Acephala macrosclerotiorum]|nr:hypothetical protein BDZ45DRAFT_740943 [Acephala macrosclerotiorum]
MRTSTFALAALAAFAGRFAAVSVVGTAEGFGKSTTGGGSATPAYPKDIAELTTCDQMHMTDVSRYNFIGSEGTVTENGCRPASNKCPGAGGQDAINHADWCTSSDDPCEVAG